MASPVKTIQAEPFAIQLVAAATGSIHSLVYDVSTKFSGSVFWDFAPADNTASAMATQLSIQCSQKATGDDTWVSLQDWLSPTIVGGTITASGTSGTPTLTTSAVTAAMNRYFLYEAGTIANSEWVMRTAQSGGGPTYTVTVEDNLAHGHLAGTPLLAGAERFKFDVDLTGVTRVRFSLYNNLGTTTRPVVCRVGFITVDSVQ